MNIIGHNKQLDQLEHVLQGGLQHHAFLFSGPNHLGKRVVAERYAEAYIMQKKPHWSHDRGDINAWRDIVVCEPLPHSKTSNRLSISAEQVRDLRQKVMLSSDSGRRVVLIDRLELASVTAQNVLLKMIEEPTEGTIFIIITAQSEQILKTISSRTMIMTFDTLPDAKLLERYDELIIDVAYGRPGLAELYSSDSDMLAQAQSDVELLQKISRMKTCERMTLAEELSKSKDLDRIDQILSLWVTRIRSSALKHRKPQLFKIIEKCESARGIMQHSNANKRLTLESLLLQL